MQVFSYEDLIMHSFSISKLFLQVAINDIK